MKEDDLQYAKQIFLKYAGSYFHMIRDERYEEYKELQRLKRQAPKLDDILIVGNKYLIWGQYEVIYSHKEKRSHIFILPDGSYTRFRKLSVEDVVEIK